MSRYDEIIAARQEHRDAFTKQLRESYPDPDDSVRRQCELLLDQWWPGTQA